MNQWHCSFVPFITIQKVSCFRVSYFRHFVSVLPPSFRPTWPPKAWIDEPWCFSLTWVSREWSHDIPREAVWSQFVLSRALAHVNKTLKQTSTISEGEKKDSCEWRRLPVDYVKYCLDLFRICSSLHTAEVRLQSIFPPSSWLAS